MITFSSDPTVLLESNVYQVTTVLSLLTGFLGPKQFSETKFFDLGDILDLSFSI
jgi:hypothetical protein